MDDNFSALDEDGKRPTERQIQRIDAGEQEKPEIVYEDAEPSGREAEREEISPDMDFYFETPDQKPKKTQKAADWRGDQRIKLGIDGLDEMLGGGLIKNSVTGIIGTYGTGKTTFAINFIFEGLKKGETCIFISLDERAEMLKESIKRRGYDLDA